MYAQIQPLSLSRIAEIAPSVFAERPHGGVSERYSFISTRDVLDRCLEEGLAPVSVRQSRTRSADRREFTRHELRLVQRSALEQSPERLVGDSYFQVLLTNSHDRAASFAVDAGLYRLVCSNGLTVPVEGQSAGFRIKHVGDVSDVIEGVFSVLDEQSKVLQKVEEYRGIMLPVEAQVAFATAALELRESTIDVRPEVLLRPRRWLDAQQGRQNLPRPDMWTTLNVVQENLQKGGVRGTGQSGRRLRTRAITDISADQKLNKALFVLADALKTHL
jgi:hypothetical protein